MKLCNNYLGQSLRVQSHKIDHISITLKQVSNPGKWQEVTLPTVGSFAKNPFKMLIKNSKATHTSKRENFMTILWYIQQFHDGSK